MTSLLAFLTVAVIAAVLVLAIVREGRRIRRAEAAMDAADPGAFRSFEDLDACAAADPDLSGVFGPDAADHTTTTTEGD